ncbi:MAG: hypothetical protein NVSMB1_10950 [Polyangiales bacterium]
MMLSRCTARNAFRLFPKSPEARYLLALFRIPLEPGGYVVGREKGHGDLYAPALPLSKRSPYTAPTKPVSSAPAPDAGPPASDATTGASPF